MEGSNHVMTCENKKKTLLRQSFGEIENETSLMIIHMEGRP